MTRRDWRTEKAKAYILSNLESVEVYGYAEPFDRFHYKTYWFTPHGVIKLDTLGLIRLRKQEALEILDLYNQKASRDPRRYGTRLFHAQEIIDSWKDHGWDPCSRAFEKEIVAAWEDK